MEGAGRSWEWAPRLWERVWGSPGGWQGLTVLGFASPEGHYLHLDFNTFHQSGVARLRSAPIWDQGPLCVRFAYCMFGLSWGAQLKLLLVTGTKYKHSNLLWKHINVQSPSWMPTAVTVPSGYALPSQVRPRAEPRAPLEILVSGVGDPEGTGAMRRCGWAI